MRNLAGNEKCFHQFAFAAYDHAGKPLEPVAFRNFWLRFTPVREQPDLIRCNLPLLNALDEVGQ